MFGVFGARGFAMPEGFVSTASFNLRILGLHERLKPRLSEHEVSAI